MVYSYYDYLTDHYTYWEAYYDDYYENEYWPKYYNVYNISNDSWCDFAKKHVHTTTDSPWTTSSAMDNCTHRYNGTFPPSPIHYERWWYEAIDTIGLSQIPIASIMAILSIIIAIFFFIQLRTAMQHPKNRPDTLTVLMSSLCVISHVMYNILDVFQFYFWFYDYNWDAYTYIEWAWEIFWMTGKVCLYSLFAYRYYILQNASIVEPSSKRHKIVLFGLIIGCIVTQIVLDIVYGIFFFDHMMTGFEDEDYEAKQRRYLDVRWALMALDLVLVLFLGFLIMRTILRLVVIIDDGADDMTSTKQTQSIPSVGSATSNGSGNADVVDAMQQQTKPSMFRVLSKSISAKKSQISEEREKRSSRQVNLLHVTTRIALTCAVSVLSSFIIQLTWLIVEETDNQKMMFMSWFWGIDGVINVCCVYFSMAFAKEHYSKVCSGVCKCHQCCLSCVMMIVGHQLRQKQMDEAGAVDVTDVSPRTVEATATECVSSSSPTATETV
eukprot:238088_1